MKYDAAATTALALIQRKGAAISVSRKSDGGFDPVTQQETAPTETTTSGFGVRLPPGKSAEKVLGTLVGRNIAEFFIASKGLAFDPLPGDRITFASQDWAVIWAQTYDPAGDGSILTKAYAER